MKVLAARTVHSLLLSEIPLGYAARRHDDALQAISPGTRGHKSSFSYALYAAKECVSRSDRQPGASQAVQFLGIVCTQFQRGEEYTQVGAPVCRSSARTMQLDVSPTGTANCCGSSLSCSAAQRSTTLTFVHATRAGTRIDDQTPGVLCAVIDLPSGEVRPSERPCRVPLPMPFRFVLAHCAHAKIEINNTCNKLSRTPSNPRTPITVAWHSASFAGVKLRRDRANHHAGRVEARDLHGIR
jgi:hypothetical protein